MKAYMAITSSAYGMENNAKLGVPTVEYDIGMNNDIALQANTCGGVYEMLINFVNLGNGQTGRAMFPKVRCGIEGV